MTVTINGANFTGASALSFGGTAAASFVVQSATRITAIVPSGAASGAVSVTTPNGTGSRSGFTFVASPPLVTSFSPASAAANATVLIRGSGFTSATAVAFGGVAAASFTLTGDTLITARVRAGSASGTVSVTTAAGTGSAVGFTYIPAPTITTVAPTSAQQGDTVSLTGTSFTGTTSVTLGGTPAAILSVSATSVRVIVGSGATGAVSLTTPGGTATWSGFTFLPPGPRITGFTPATAAPGTSVVITGTGFTGATAVRFGGIAAASFVVNSATRITAVVAAGSSSGAVSVTTGHGTATMAGFTYTPLAAPVITSFTPTSAARGATVVINGQNFSGVGITTSSVSIGGVAVPFVVNSATRITATLTNAASGAVSVTTQGGTATMAGFIWTGGTFAANAENDEAVFARDGSQSNEEGNTRIIVYPNPATDATVVNVPKDMLQTGMWTLRLVTTLGLEALRLRSSTEHIFLPLHDLPSGIYTVILETGTKRYSQRFVKY
jgi:hypothetical protein